LGEPLDDQLTGTPGEKLIEVGTRLCYDSLGRDAHGKRKGRSTKKTLANVLTVKHYSVLEHYVRTVALKWNGNHATLLEACMNRPGVFIRFDGDSWRITVNVRAVLEWDKWSGQLGDRHFDYPHYEAQNVGNALRYRFAQAVPLLVSSPGQADGILCGEFVMPETNAERWVSMYLVGSRGFSHEMVRHRFAISQRSTRYCQESESKWHLHPLIDRHHTADLDTATDNAMHYARTGYDTTMRILEEWLLDTLPEDTPYRAKTARKQARGAARGLLGNALETQMVFSAPVWAWKHIAHMRAADAADAEIREIIADAISELKTSRYAPEFADLSLGPASDGIGRSLVSGGHE